MPASKVFRLLPIFFALSACGQVLEDYSCAYPAEISNGRPAVVTCASPHGFKQRAYFRWTFGGVSAAGSTITIGAVSYTLAAEIDNSVPNQILIGATAAASARNLALAVNGDPASRGTAFSSATQPHPEVEAFPGSDAAARYVDFWHRTGGPAGLRVEGRSSSGANGGFDSPAMRSEWAVNISGATGSWSGLGTDQTPRGWTARYLTPSTFALYTRNGVPADTSAMGPYRGQAVTITRSSGDGNNYPFAYTGESWSLSSAITPEGTLQVNIPGCADSSREAECSMAFRIPEVSKYPGLSQRVSSFSVSGGVATIKLASPFPYTSGEVRALKRGSLLWVRNIADPPGSWTHTASRPNSPAGTAKNRLVKFSAQPEQVEALAKGDRGGAIGVCQEGCGTQGTAVIADGGLATCTFDGPTTAGNWVTVTGYDDRCRDAGAAFPVAPQAIGIVLETGPAGDHPVWWNGLNRAFAIQSVNGPGDGSGVTEVTVNTPGYPDGSYAAAALRGYAGGSTPTYAFVSSTYNVNPYIYFVGRSGGGYLYPWATLQALARNQADYIPGKTNRMEFWIRWEKSRPACGIEIGSQIGTFGIPPGFTNLSGHFYHSFDAPSYAGQWTRYIWTNTPSHAEGVQDTAFNYPNDPGQSGSLFAWNGRRPYFDSMGAFYMDLFGIACKRDVSGQKILVSPLTYSSVADEPDELVLTRGGMWSPARFERDGSAQASGTAGYDLFWSGPKANRVLYEVRYSTAGPLKQLGFSAGLCKNGSTACDAADRVSTNGSSAQVYYQSATMAEEGRIWWGIKPVSIPLIAASGAGQRPAWVITPVSLGVAAGDLVTVAGAGGNQALNQTAVPALAVQPYQFWSRFDATQRILGGLSYSNAAGTIQVRLASHGYSTGDRVQISGAAPAALNREWTITVVDANLFVLDGAGFEICPCSGGSSRRLVDSDLLGIESDGAGTCAVKLATPHNLVPGWKVLLGGSAHNGLTPAGAPTPYTVLATPSPHSFQIACPAAPAGTYSLGANNTAIMSIAAYPGIALDVTGDGNYTGGGFIFSNEDKKGFAEIELWTRRNVLRRIHPRSSPESVSRNSRAAANAAQPCAYELSPGKAFWPSAGGSGTIVVAANPGCSWTVSSDSAWLTPASAAGSGGAEIGYFIAPNAGPRRSATLMVAGLVFTVRQAAKAGPPAKTGVFRRGAWLLDETGDGSAYVAGAQGAGWSNAGPDGAPVLGDWNGDGRTKTGIFRDGVWELDLHGGGTPAIPARYDFEPGDIPVLGDWNGDGRTKTGVFRRGIWLVDFDGDGRQSERARYAFEPGDIPVSGDWNGDGRTKTGVYRRGVWLLDSDGDGKVDWDNPGADRMFRHSELPGDVPLTGRWMAGR